MIWLLFSRDNSGVFGPKHLLCDGYRRSAIEKAEAETIPGVFSRFPNDQVASLKASPWPQLLALLGQSGEKIMINLLVDCSIFVAVESGLNNFYQISGTSMAVPMSRVLANTLARKANIRARIWDRKKDRTQKIAMLAQGIRNHSREKQTVLCAAPYDVHWAHSARV